MLTVNASRGIPPALGWAPGTEMILKAQVGKPRVLRLKAWRWKVACVNGTCASAGGWEATREEADAKLRAHTKGLRELHRSCHKTGGPQMHPEDVRTFGAEAQMSVSAPGGALQGRAYLVGAGPGDPELLTVKALRLLGSADLVLYDKLVSDEIMALVHPAAVKVPVGKESGCHLRRQEEIHGLMGRLLAEGRTVVRLKGGDPGIFGRGGEEMEYLEGIGVPVSVVPGITAAAGVTANLSVPLTHRDFASGVTLLSGHGTDGALHADFEALASSTNTLVVYMGLKHAEALAAGLLQAGSARDLPVLAVERGTTLSERVVLTDLAHLAEDARTLELQCPTLLVIGGVATFVDPTSAASWAARIAGDLLIAPPKGDGLSRGGQEGIDMPITLPVQWIAKTQRDECRKGNATK